MCGNFKIVSLKTHIKYFLITSRRNMNHSFLRLTRFGNRLQVTIKYRMRLLIYDSNDKKFES